MIPSRNAYREVYEFYYFVKRDENKREDKSKIYRVTIRKDIERIASY